MEAAKTAVSLTHIVKLVADVKHNYADFLQEWSSLKQELDQDSKDGNFKRPKLVYKVSDADSPGQNVYVKKDDLSRLATEIAQLKQNIPKVLTKNVITACTRVQLLEHENEQLVEHCRLLTQQKEEASFKYEKAIAETQTEKQECLKLRCEIQALSQQLSQQSDYCTSLGSSCGALLWRVSRREDSVQDLLNGTKVDEFFSLVSSTLQSYLAAYKDEWPSEDLEETQFVFALSGTITNIAASAYGRDFLMSNSHGKEILDTYIELLSEAPTGSSAKLKSLLMMTLYNISINQKGLKYISSKAGLLSLAAWLVQAESDGELRLNALRLIQSLVLDDGNRSVVHELHEMLPGPVLEQLSTDQYKPVRELALELISDLQQLHQRQHTDSRQPEQ